MAGHGVDDDPNLKGFARYFNSETNRGRTNVSSENPIQFDPSFVSTLGAERDLFIHLFIYDFLFVLVDSSNCSGPKQLMLLSV